MVANLPPPAAHCGGRCNARRPARGAVPSDQRFDSVSLKLNFVLHWPHGPVDGSSGGGGMLGWSPGPSATIARMNPATGKAARCSQDESQAMPVGRLRRTRRTSWSSGEG
ncbi:hypothetical protein ZWY2020_015056 [Hordeum vulgare]|nr:hypothetical protein ZWY2020_015056 [Hordeum vulgare]